MNKKVVLLIIACLPLQIHPFYNTQESSTGKTTITLERDQYSSSSEQNTKQTITIDNKTDKPVIINFYANGKPSIGYYGMLVKEYKVMTVTMPQFLLVY